VSLFLALSAGALAVVGVRLATSATRSTQPEQRIAPAAKQAPGGATLARRQFSAH
jgi:hypothetical protein